MVRISEKKSLDGKRVVKLEGTVVGSSVEQVESFCRGVLAQGLPLTIDMAEVSFLDARGVRLFKELLSQKVRLLNSSPFLNELLKSAALGSPIGPSSSAGGV
jgi:anti-anti-sigma regulatory factor